MELQVTVETNGEEHIQRITEVFAEHGYTIHRINTSEVNEYNR